MFMSNNKYISLSSLNNLSDSRIYMDTGDNLWLINNAGGDVFLNSAATFVLKGVSPNRVGIGNSSPTYKLDVAVSDTVNNAASGVFRLRHRLSSGTVANNFGIEFMYDMQASDGSIYDAVRQVIQWSDATAPTRKARYTLSVYDTVVRLAHRVDTDGTGVYHKIAGGVQHSVRTSSITTTLLLTDHTLEITAAVDVNLMTAASAFSSPYGSEFEIIAQADNVRIVPNGSEKINGESEIIMMKNDSATLRSNGTAWRIV
jgi:hypothetical protein